MANRTTKRSAGGFAPPAVAYDLEQPNPITREEAEHLCGLIHGKLSDSGDPEPVCAAFLLLLNYLAFEEDDTKRFAVWFDARSMFALDLSKPYDALEKQLGAELAKMRKGGAK